MGVDIATTLQARVVAWYTAPRDRIREGALKGRVVVVDDGGNLDDLFVAVKTDAIRVFKRQRKNCEALRLTVEFSTGDGVEAKVSYLVERDRLPKSRLT